MQSTHIYLIKPESERTPVCDQEPLSYVKLAAVNEQWLFWRFIKNYVREKYIERISIILMAKIMMEKKLKLVTI